ncbi:CAP domain-containing protein [Labedella endophytica]|nr:CAP domain-containing protein [Labedella endophytica]
MKRMLRLFAVLSIGILVGSASAATTMPAPAHAETSTQSVIRITNEHRAANGRAALTAERSLNHLAQAWANRMATTGKLEHSTNAWRSGSATPGYTLCCGENIAKGYSAPGTMVKVWMGSSGHRANILDARFTHIGVGYNAKGNFWVQLFAAYPKPTAATAETATQSVIRITNEHRAANGRKALTPERSLNHLAQAWANKMSADGKMVHSTNAWRSGSATPGYTLCCGENIAYGYTSPGTMVKAWMGSSGHRANILDARYTHIGVGYNAKGHYWVQLFAAYP